MTPQRDKRNPIVTQLVAKLPHPLRPILLGVLVFAVLNLILSVGITISPLNSKFNFKYGNFLPTKLAMLNTVGPKHVDALFLGTSQTNNGFIPSVFAPQTGTQVFNLGLPNNRYDLMETYLKVYSQQYGKPKQVLVEVSPSIQEKDSAMVYLPALYYRTILEQAPSQTPSVLLNPQVSWEIKKELVFSGISALRQYRLSFSPVNILDKVAGKLPHIGEPPTAEAETPNVSSAAEATSEDEDYGITITPEMTQYGWFPKAQSVHMKTPEGLKASIVEAKKYYIDPQPSVNFEKLTHLVSWSQAQGIDVVLVTWPNHPAYRRTFETSHLAKPYHAGLSKLVETTGVPLIDLNDDIPASQRADQAGYFADPRHLTAPGAQYFSHRLAQRLQALETPQQD